MSHIISNKPAPSIVVAPAVQTLAINEASEGQRLDNYLFKTLKGVPKTYIYRIIRSGEVRVNKGRASAETKLVLGDVIRVPPVRVSEAVQDKIDHSGSVYAHSSVRSREFPVLFEDDYFLAIDKPAGTAVHGGSGVSFGVIEQLRRARPDAKFLELVHRLDRETSGVLLIAKRRSALTNLQAQFKERETGKTYLALVLGNYPANKKVIDVPLFKYLDSNEERRVRVVAKDDPNGMKSVTLVKVRQANENFSLLEVTIKTGRTHQIRVHLASTGHVIAGDDKYGDFDRNKQLAKHGHNGHKLSRMFLHAWRLELTHPATGVRQTLMTELPGDLAVFAQSTIPSTMPSTIHLTRLTPCHSSASKR